MNARASGTGRFLSIPIGEAHGPDGREPLVIMDLLKRFVVLADQIVRWIELEASLIRLPRRVEQACLLERDGQVVVGRRARRTNLDRTLP